MTIRMVQINAKDQSKEDAEFHFKKNVVTLHAQIVNGKEI